MTTSAYSPDTYAGDDVQDTFAITFGFLSVSTNVKVSVKVDSTGVTTVKTAGSHYNVSGSNVVFTGGNIPATGETVILELNPDFIQGSNYKENARFPAATVETDLDERNLESQINKDLVSRSIKMDSDVDMSTFDPTLPSPTADNYLQINSAGTGIDVVSSACTATNVDAAGAVMNSDISTAAMSFVIDEDDMASNSDTKVPTQQSVKAYVQSKTLLSNFTPSSTDTLTNKTIDTASNTITVVEADISDLGSYITDVVSDTTPQLGGDLDCQSFNIQFDGTFGDKGIFNSDGNELLVFAGAGAAVNHVLIYNNRAGGGPIIQAVGDDTNVDLRLQGQGTGGIVLIHPGDSSREFKFSLTGATSGNTLTLAGIQTSDITVTFPDASDTLVGKATTDTLTNKTFDANGTGNSLSNVDVADLSSGTDGELITWDAAGAPATVAAGTSGHVLTSNGAGAAPTFQAAGGGGVSDNQRLTRHFGLSVGGLNASSAYGYGLWQSGAHIDSTSSNSGSADGAYFQQNTSTTANNVAYTRASQNTALRIDNLPIFAIRFSITSTSDVRFFAGLSTSGINTTVASDDPAADMIGIQYSTNASDTTFYFVHKDHPTAITRVDTSETVSTSVYTFIVEFTTTTNAVMTLYNNSGSQLATTTATTNLPPTGGNMFSGWAVETLTTSAKGIRMFTCGVSTTNEGVS